MAENRRQDGAEVTPPQQPARSVDVVQSAVEKVDAETVTVRQGAVKEIRARDVLMRQGAAVTVLADNSVQMVQGAVGIVRSGEAQVGPGSSAGAILADTVSLDQAMSQFTLARDSVELDQSMAGVLVGQNVHARNSAALLMFANNVEGDVHVAMDRQAAITFGAAVGAALGLFLFLGRLLRRK